MEKEQKFEENKESCSEGKCFCDDNCTCGCNEGKECSCNDECTCDDNCKCHEKRECDCDCCEDECVDGCDCDDCHNDEAGQYLAMAQRLQADFDNYRKRVAEQLDFQKQEGKRSVIEVFLPCLDTFKEAKKTITDEKVLEGVNMIENKILGALKSLNVEKIEAEGQKYDHNLHEVVAVMCDESKENDIILNEFQAGYKFNGKVIRYSKVIVNKKGE